MRETPHAESMTYYEPTDVPPTKGRGVSDEDHYFACKADEGRY